MVALAKPLRAGFTSHGLDLFQDGRIALAGTPASHPEPALVLQSLDKESKDL